MLPCSELVECYTVDYLLLTHRRYLRDLYGPNFRFSTSFKTAAANIYFI